MPKKDFSLKDQERLRQGGDLANVMRSFPPFFIAPKASAEGACIFMEVGYYGACMMGYHDCA